MNEERLRTVFLQRLARQVELPSLRVAILDLLTTCIEHQPGLADMFLNLPRSEEERQKRLEHPAPADSCLDVVHSILIKKTINNLDRHPQLFAAALGFLHTLWKFAPRHQPTIRYIKQVDDFWKQLVLPLIEGVHSPRLLATPA